MLLAAVATIWGTIAWKLLSPGTGIPPAVAHSAPDGTGSRPTADTLAGNYPDPFLKGTTSQNAPAGHTAATPPPRHTTLRHAQRKQVDCEHLGSVRSGGRTIHIIDIGGIQYEAERGDSAAGFIVAGSDRDSLYLVSNGVKYGVKLCE